MKSAKIGVILGGLSSEREISMRSGKAVAGALRNRGYSVTEIGEYDLSHCPWPVKEGMSGTESGESEVAKTTSDTWWDSIPKMILDSGIDIAFIALHGRYGEDGTIQKLLEDSNIPYTGSGPEASKKALHKGIAKKVFVQNKILTPEYMVISKKERNHIKDRIKRGFSFPLVLKPVCQGSSIGLSVINDKNQLEDALEEAFSYDHEIIAERYVPGREITVGILDNAPLGVVQIKPREDFYNYKAKYTSGITEYIAPAELTPRLYKMVQLAGVRAHRALGCRDFSRVDLRVDLQGRPWVLEVNTIPGFTETSLLPKAASAVGIRFEDLCERILTLSWSRHKRCYM